MTGIPRSNNPCLSPLLAGNSTRYSKQFYNTHFSQEVTVNMPILYLIQAN